MAMRTNAAGVACCGSCGSELMVVCTGGCAEPDIRPRANYIASLKKSSGGQIGARRKQKRTPIERPGFCVVPECIKPVKTYSGRGRVPIKCDDHMPKSRAKVAA